MSSKHEYEIKAYFKVRSREVAQSTVKVRKQKEAIH
jgi:hypothetical protein